MACNMLQKNKAWLRIRNLWKSKKKVRSIVI